MTVSIKKLKTMKYHVFVLFFILTGFKATCQIDSIYHYRVEYEMTLSLNGSATYDANFYFNSSQSIFEFKERIFEDTVNVENDKDLNIKVNLDKPSLFYIKNNLQTKKTLANELGYQKNEMYEIEEPIPTINWNITEEVKKINQIECFKATCNFRGRNYTVWFTPDIHTNFGPLKLNGLPGLILETHDDTNEVVLYAKSIKIEDKKIDNKPSGLKVISRAEYKNLKEEMLKKLNEVASRIKSGMDRGVKTSIKIKLLKTIEVE